MPNVRADALTVGAGAVAIVPNGGDAGTSVVDSLTFNGSSKLDLNNNDLVVRATALSKDAEHANIEARIISAKRTRSGADHQVGRTGHHQHIRSHGQRGARL